MIRHLMFRDLTSFRDSFFRDSTFRDSFFRDSTFRDTTFWDSTICDSTVCVFLMPASLPCYMGAVQCGRPI